MDFVTVEVRAATPFDPIPRPAHPPASLAPVLPQDTQDPSYTYQQCVSRGGIFSLSILWGGSMDWGWGEEHGDRKTLTP